MFYVSAMRQFDTGMQNMWTANKFLPKCWNRKLDYHFLQINIFSSGWRRVPPLARWLGTSTPSSWGSSRTARTLSRTLRLSTLMKWAENKNTVLSLHTNFKSTSNPNSLGDVRSLPRRRQRLWRTSCRWEVLRSWEGETRLHFEQITILIKHINHRDAKAEPIWFKSVSLHFQPKWSIGGYPHVVGRVIRGHRFIETY